MCKNYIQIIDGKLEDIKGIFKKGAYIICLECEGIFKISSKHKEIARLKRIK